MGWRKKRKEGSVDFPGKSIFLGRRKKGAWVCSTNDLVRCRDGSEHGHEGSRNIHRHHTCVVRFRYRGQHRQQRDRIFHHHNFFDADSGKNLLFSTSRQEIVDKGSSPAYRHFHLMMDSQPSSSFANQVPYRPSTNPVRPPSEQHVDHQQQSSRSAGSTFESSSKTQALDSISENDMATRFSTFRHNGHWDPLTLQYVLAILIILP